MPPAPSSKRLIQGGRVSGESIADQLRGSSRRKSGKSSSSSVIASVIALAKGASRREPTKADDRNRKRQISDLARVPSKNPMPIEVPCLLRFCEVGSRNPCLPAKLFLAESLAFQQFSPKHAARVTFRVTSHSDFDSAHWPRPFRSWLFAGPFANACSLCTPNENSAL